MKAMRTNKTPCFWSVISPWGGGLGVFGRTLLPPDNGRSALVGPAVCRSNFDNAFYLFWSFYFMVPGDPGPGPRPRTLSLGVGGSQPGPGP